MTPKKRTLLASAGAAGLLGALAIGGVAYAVGNDGTTGQSPTPAYVTVEDDGSSTAPGQRSGGRDCPEKQGGDREGTSPSTPSSPESEAPSQTPSETPSDTAADL